jgi:hypothetical protein
MQKFKLRMTWAIGLGLTYLVSGCGSRDESLSTLPAVVARAKLGNELLFVDSTEGTVHALDVMAKQVRSTTQRIDIPASPLIAVERPNKKEVLVLCAGARDANDEWLETPALVVIDEKHSVRNYPLSTPLSAIRLTQDGRYAVLFVQGDSKETSDLLSNPNRVALVDLDAKPSNLNPTERTLKAPGGALRSVTLTEPLEVIGQSRPFALFTFDDGISVWDLSHPERVEITSEGLAALGSVNLRRVVTDPANGTIYLIQSGLTDLRVLDLNNEASGKDNDFWPSWNQLPLDSSSASDLVLYQEEDEPRVLVAVGQQVRIIDSNDSRVVPIALNQSVTQFYTFEGIAPNDPTVRSRVLGYSPNSSSVTFIELKELEARGSRNTEVLELGNPLSRIVPLSSTRLLTEFASGGIGVLDLESRRFTPLTASVELTAPLVESDIKRVWVGAAGNYRVGYFEPSTLETGDLRLDAAIEDLYLFENDSRRRIVVSHASTWGQVTVVDTEQATRSKATVIDGFLLDGLVKR